MKEQALALLKDSWPYIVVGGILLFEDWIARSKYKSNSTIQLLGVFLRKIPVLNLAFRFFDSKKEKSDG